LNRAHHIAAKLLEADPKDWLVSQDYAAPDPSETAFFLDIEWDEDGLPDWDRPDDNPADAAAHDQVMADIERRLNNGDYWAYGQLMVTAAWKHPYTEEVFTGEAYLGGVSYKDANDFIQNSGYFGDLAQEAYDEMVKAYKAESPAPGFDDVTDAPGERVPQEAVLRAGVT